MILDVEDVEDDIEGEEEDWDEVDEDLGVDDGDEEEDPFDALDEEECKKLLENTFTVCATLNKVFTFFITNFLLSYSHLFSKDPKNSFSSTQQPKPFLLGTRPAPLINSLFISFHGM